MTKTPTLRVSADLLDLKAAPPLPGSSLGEVLFRVKIKYQEGEEEEEEFDQSSLIMACKRTT
jgi:hypothetical protein